MGLGLGIDIRLSDIRQAVASGVTQLIQWILPFNINGTAEYPTDSSGDVTSSGTSATYARTFDATNGLVITSIAAGTPVSEGMRWNGSAFVNDDGSGNALHPTKTYTHSDNTEQTVYLEAQDWQATTAYSLGDWVYGANGNHNYYYECTTAGTSDASEPTWPTSSTVADGTAVWTYQGRYNNTGQVPHVLNEPAATNLALQSQDFTTTWVATSITTNAAVAPDGTTTADEFLGSDIVRQDISSDGTNNTFSVWVKKATTSSATNIRLSTNDTAAWNTGVSVKFALTDTWQRLSISGDLLPSSASSNIRVAVGKKDETGADDATCAGRFYIWGAQYETGSVATSYIPTTTGTVTRAATVHSGTPDVSSDYMTFRVWNNTTGDQVFISDGTDKISYSSGDIVVTDGTNSLSYTHTLAKGDIIGWDNALAKLYVNGSNVATGGAPANVSLALSGTIYVGGDSSTGSEVNGGMTDFVSSTSLDLTDITWSTP